MPAAGPDWAAATSPDWAAEPFHSTSTSFLARA